MRRNLFIITSLITIALIVFSCGTTQPDQQVVTEVSKDSLIKRGEYLVSVMGCNDCHTPKKMTPQGPAPDMDRLLSGHPSAMPVFPFDTTTTRNWVLFNMSGTAMVGPWGASFAANLTSDSTGIGNWTEAQFKKALTEGKFKGLDGTRPLLPPMPWQNYTNMKNEDISAIFAFLKSTKPVNNVVPTALAPHDLVAKTK